MYCTPWARLMKSITPNTSVSPAATRNSSTPSCNPLKHWTTNSEVDMGRSGLRHVIPVLVTGIHRVADAGACGWLDTGDKPRYDSVVYVEPEITSARSPWHSRHP